jgi:hypothetical protein
MKLKLFIWAIIIGTALATWAPLAMARELNGGPV